MSPGPGNVHAPPAPVVLMIMVTWNESALPDGGVKLQLAPAGSPLQANVIGATPLLASTFKTVKTDFPRETCKLTVWALMIRGDVPICVGSLAVSFAVLISPPPETVAVLVTVGAMFTGTFTTRVIAGWLAAVL